MATDRRMGPPGSPTWISILDASEEILRDEGYAALTSRRIAERVGIKQRLVYYYFRTMDEVIVETFRRLARREMGRLASAVGGGQPLHAIWNVSVETSDARLISEFMALSNRIDELRGEVIAYVEGARRLQVDALAAAGVRSETSGLSPEALALLATSSALALIREADLGVDMGHGDLRSAIARMIESLEPSI